jgi:hypothetical protein
MLSADSAITVIIIILVELAVMLCFFRKEWLQCIHFTVAVNLMTFAMSYLIIRYAIPITADMLWAKVIMEITMGALEAVIIFFFFDVGVRKAILISLLCNCASFLIFVLLNWLQLSPQNFVLN